MQSSEATFTDCIFVGNTAVGGPGDHHEFGGGFASWFSTPTLTRCTFIDNVAGRFGGAICIHETGAVIESCTIVGNQAAEGAAIYIFDSGTLVTLSNTIIAFNQGLKSVYCFYGLALIDMTCCDVYGNPGGDYVDCIADMNGIDGNISADPLFCDLDNDDLTLAANSPCAPFSYPNEECDQIGAWPVGCDPTTYVVRPDGQGDYPTIQEAIDAVWPGSVIELTDGTFTGNGNRDIEFQGKAVTVKSQNGHPGDCVIDCEGNFFQPHRGFYFHQNEGPGSVLHAVTISGGYAAGLGVLGSGGGILCNGSAPTIEYCVLEDNTAVVSGGGMSVNLGTLAQEYPTVTGCTFAENTAVTGGGLYCVFATPAISGCTFADNSATGSGGGLYYNNGNGPPSNPELAYCLFHHNTAPQGGGLACYRTSADLYRCTIGDNTAAGGAGMWCGLQSDAVVSKTIIAFNIDGDAVACSDGGTATLDNSDVYGNPEGNWTGCLEGQQGVNCNFSADPQFCHRPSGNYHFKKGSPCGPYGPCGLIGALDIVQECSAPAPPGLNGAISRRTGPVDRSLNVRIEPNPFNPATDISFRVPKTCRVRLDLYDIKGRRIETLVDQTLDAGEHRVFFDARRHASGVYFYSLRADRQVATGKLTLLK